MSHILSWERREGVHKRTQHNPNKNGSEYRAGVECSIRECLLISALSFHRDFIFYGTVSEY